MLLSFDKKKKHQLCEMRTKQRTDASAKSKTLVATILSQMPGIKKPTANFMIDLLSLFLSMRGRYNFLGFERYGEKNEKSYRNGFEQDFDFLTFNTHLIEQNFGSQLVNIFDPSFLPKSGKSTPNTGKFYSGCVGKALNGMEIGGLAVADIDQHTALHLEAIPTPNPALFSEEKTLLSHYGEVIVQRKDSLLRFSKYLAVDGWFSKKPFVDTILDETELQLISKLRKDARLKYLYNGPRSKKRGRPKKYDGDIDLNQMNLKHFQLCYKDESVELWEAKVWSVSLKREIKLVYAKFLNQGKPTNRFALLFSTDLDLDGQSIYQFYKIRFQIEFLFRDAKQFTGLTHCQARSEKKLNFHFNASLTAVNIAKVAHHFDSPLEQRKAFSLADIKTMHFNELMFNFFLSKFEINPNLDKIKNIKREVLALGKIAA